MSAATIVFCDIVGFSKKKAEKQLELIQSLNAEVTHELYSYLRQPYQAPQFITIPTGDGLIIALLQIEDRKWNEQLFELVARLMRWHKNEDVGIRIGVHCGAINIVPDINNRPNIAGSTINSCQRVMDAANDNQVLFSKEAYMEYIGDEEHSDETLIIDNMHTVDFDGPHGIIAKHNTPFSVYVMHIGNEHADWWDDSYPLSKDFMPIAINPSTKDNEQEFKEKLIKAKEIALIQLTGYRLQQYILADDFTLSKDLEKLIIYMPDHKTFKQESIEPVPQPEVIENSLAKWRQIIVAIAKRYPNAEIKLKTFEQLPFFCGSFFDWRKNKGVISITPFVWGNEVSRCPAFEMQWVGDDSPAVYDTYCRGLEQIDGLATTIYPE